MSYGFKVKFVDGEAQAYDTYGEPPTDGEEIWVNSHSYASVSWPQISIGVTLVDNEQRLIVSGGANAAR